MAEINLVVNTFIIGLLFSSLALKVKGRLVAHGIGALVAVVMIFSGIPWLLGAEVPTIDTYMQGIMNSSLKTTLFTVQFFLGTATLVLASLLLVKWRLRSPDFVARKKNVMRATFAFWVSAYAVGILLFLAVNTSFFG